MSIGTCAVLAAVLAPAPANAAESRAYSTVTCVALPEVGVYAQIHVTGTISFQREHTRAGMRFFNVTIRNPSLQVSARTGCGRTAHLVTRRKAVLSQGFYAESCSANSGLSVSFPWGISASPTYDCGRESIGVNNTSYGTDSVWTQNNSGAPVTWTSKIFGSRPGETEPAWPCISMSVSVTIYQRANTSDTGVIGNNEKFHPLAC